jgi:hypothetical protein
VWYCAPTFDQAEPGTDAGKARSRDQSLELGQPTISRIVDRMIRALGTC